MNSWALVILTFFILSIQSTLVRFLEIGGFVPDFPLIFLVIMSLKRGPIAGASIGFLMGIITDVYDYNHLGAHALAGTLVGYFTGFANEQVIELDRVSKTFFMAFAFTVYDMIFAFSQQSNGLKLVPYLLDTSLPSGAYTLLFGAFFIYFQSTERHHES